MSKYHSRKTEYKGVIYDSAAEAKMARDLDFLLLAGEVKRVERQVEFKLFGMHGTAICVHRVDFHVLMADGSAQVWECKGYRTRDWVIKRKLFEDNYPNVKYIVPEKRRRKRTIR